MYELKKSIEILESCLADWEYGATKVYSIMTRIKEAVELLKEQPQFVRCRNCKNRNSRECWLYFFGRVKLPDDFFCGDGKPKEGVRDGV